jgi:D-serine deaminase-like pyridoxal phosphate-dependent protein
MAIAPPLPARSSDSVPGGRPRRVGRQPGRDGRPRASPWPVAAPARQDPQVLGDRPRPGGARGGRSDGGDLGETEVFAEAGFTDLFIAYPLWVAGERGRRLCALADRAALRVSADSAEGVEVLARALEGPRWKSRSRSTAATIAPRCSEARRRGGAAARRLRTAMGWAWPGCLPSRGTATSPAAGSRRQRMRRAHAGGGCYVAQARAGGPARRIDADRGAGDPRGAERDATRRVRLQRRPAGRARAADWDAVALTAAATVMSRHGRDIVLDAGRKVLGADRLSWASGVAGCLTTRTRGSARCRSTTTVSFAEDAPMPKLGSLVRVAPTLSVLRSTSPTYSSSPLVEQSWSSGKSRPAAGTPSPLLRADGGCLLMRASSRPFSTRANTSGPSVMMPSTPKHRDAVRRRAPQLG